MKKILLISLFLFLFWGISEVNATKQVFVNGSNNALNTANTTEYNGVSHSGSGSARTWSGTEHQRSQIMPANGTLRNLVVEINNEPGVGNTWVFTLRKDETTDTLLTCTISSGQTSCDDQDNDITVTAGDIYSLKVVSVSTPNAATASGWSIEFEGDTTSQNVLMGVQSSPLVSADSYALPNVQDSDSATEADNTLLVPLDGTINALYVEISTAAGVGNTWVVSIFKNGSIEASSSVTISGDSETADNVTGLSIDIAPGDTLSIQAAPASTPSATSMRYSMLITSDTDGESIVGSRSSDTLNVNSNDYNHFTGSGSVAWQTSAGENLVVALAGITSFTLKNFRVEISGAPGAGNNYLFTVRKDSAAGNSNCTISNPGTTCIDSINTDDFVSGNNLTIESNPFSAPTTRTAKWSIIQFIEPAAPADNATDGDFICKSGVCRFMGTIRIQ